MTSCKKIKKTEKKNNSTEQFFFRKKIQKDSGKDCNSLDKSFNSIYNFYSSLANNQIYKSMKIKDCYALILARAIIERLSGEKIQAGKDNSLPVLFYENLADILMDENSDRQIVLINLKQMTNIMKRCGLIRFQNRVAFTDSLSIGSENLYLRLLESFWNKTDWSEIFPSSPESAVKLYEKRKIFTELLQSFYTEVSIEDISNDFFAMTGFCEQNDYFMISFIDFYLITWLKHFGILDYAIKKNTEIVYLSIHDYGRDIIRKIL